MHSNQGHFAWAWDVLTCLNHERSFWIIIRIWQNILNLFYQLLSVLICLNLKDHMILTRIWQEHSYLEYSYLFKPRKIFQDSYQNLTGIFLSILECSYLFKPWKIFHDSYQNLTRTFLSILDVLSCLNHERSIRIQDLSGFIPGRSYQFLNVLTCLKNERSIRIHTRTWQEHQF